RSGVRAARRAHRRAARPVPRRRRGDLATGGHEVRPARRRRPGAGRPGRAAAARPLAMPDRIRSGPSIARYGLPDDRAAEQPRAAGWWGDAGPEPDRETSMVALSRSPDPDLALRSIDRLRTADPDGWPALDRAVATDRGLRGRLLAVLGGSTAL